MSEPKTWTVPVTVTLRGYAIVEAKDSAGAYEAIKAGGFDIEPGAEMVDWEVAGTARVDD